MAKKKRSREATEGSAPEGESAREGMPRGRRSRGVSAPLELPTWLPWVVFGVLTLLLFGGFIFSSQMLFGGDTMSLGYMARKFYADAVRAGDFPLWNPDLLGGVPFLEALSGGDSLYPSALLLFVMEPYRALGWKLVIHVFLAGAFMFGWTCRLGVSRAGALVAGIGYLLAPYLVSLVYPGHDGKIFVTALTPLLFWAMESTFHRRGLLPYAGVAGVVALVILTTHFQMAYFLFGAAGMYYAFRCTQGATAAASEEMPSTPPRDWSAASMRFGLFLAASVLGAAVAGVQLIPSFQYATEFSRRTATTTAAPPEEAKEYAASWSMHPEEVAAVVVPEFVGYGGAGQTIGEADWTNDTYWGRNFFKLNAEYVGLVVLLLAGVSFFGAAHRGVRIFLAAMGVLGLLYGLGAHTPVWHLAYALLPGVRLFRAAGMVIFLFGFAAVTLAGLGVDRLLELKDDPDSVSATRVMRFLWISTGVLGVGLLLAASGTLGSLWTALLYRDIDPAKTAALAVDQPFLVRGFVVSTALAAGTAGLIWATLRGHLPRAGLVVGLALLVVVDLWRVDVPFIQLINPSRVTEPDPIVTELMKRKASEPPFRVLSVDNDQDVTPATFGIELAGGHHPNDLARYRELTGMEASGAAVNIGNPNLLRLLNIRYLIWPTAGRGGEPNLEVVARTTVGDQVYQSLAIYPPALPRARLVGAVEVVPDDRTVARLLEESFDPGTTVLLTEAAPIELPGGPVQGDVQWTRDGLDRLELTVDSPTNALLVVADNWYPAWKATVDGAEVPVLRAYHSLRAVPVGAGRHEVVMWYDAGALGGGLMATVGGLIVLSGVVAFSLIRDRRVGSSADA